MFNSCKGGLEDAYVGFNSGYQEGLPTHRKQTISEWFHIKAVEGELLNLFDVNQSLVKALYGWPDTFLYCAVSMMGISTLVANSTSVRAFFSISSLLHMAFQRFSWMSIIRSAVSSLFSRLRLTALFYTTILQL